MIQTLENIKHILSLIDFKLFSIPFRFKVMEKGDGFLIQLECWMKCNVENEYSWQKGGKYYISSHAIDDEIILSSWKACQDFIIHEARETFFYREQPIFQPHFSMDELVEFSETAKIVSRPRNLIVEHINDLKHSQDIDF